MDKQKELTRMQMKYTFGKKEDSMNMQQKLTNAALLRQEALSVQGQQALTIANNEKDLQQLGFLKKQAELEKEKSEKELQAKYAAAIQDKKIASQNADLAFNRKLATYMWVVIGLLSIIAIVIYRNQRRTNRLNKQITQQQGELIQQKQELQNVNSIKDKLFSVISHDLRSPVNSLLSFTMLLENGSITPEKLDRYAGELKNSLGYTAGLMENLLNFAKSQMGGFKPHIEKFDLVDASDDTVMLLTPVATNKKISIQNNISDNIKVNADIDMTALVLRNLISNAIKYSQPGGTVTLAAWPENGQIVISVQDHGTGMDRAMIAALNDIDTTPRPLDSTLGTNHEKGTGLGLLLCKNFVALMKGQLSVESEKGKGSRFTVWLDTG